MPEIGLALDTLTPKTNRNHNIAPQIHVNITHLHLLLASSSSPSALWIMDRYESATLSLEYTTSYRYLALEQDTQCYPQKELQ